MTDKTYVYDELEVKMTGRVASRKSKRATSRQPEEFKDTLYEIEPVDRVVEWKKWVAMAELYEIDRGDE